MSQVTVTQLYNDKELFDHLIFGDLSPEEFMNNEKIITELSDAITKIQQLKQGHCLLTIDIKNQHNIILIVINDYNITYSRSKYFVYRTTKHSSITNPVDFKLEEINDDMNMCGIIRSNYHDGEGLIGESDVVHMMIVETLDGYKTNVKTVEDIIKKIKTYNNSTRVSLHDCEEKDRINTIFNHYDNRIQHHKDNINNKLNKFIDSIDKNNISGTIRVGNMCSGIGRVIIVIDDIIQSHNARIALVSDYTTNGRRVDRRRRIFVSRVGYNSQSFTPKGDYYYAASSRSNVHNVIANIPYNYLDKGRVFIAAGQNNGFNNIICSMDPKVDDQYMDKFLKGIDVTISENVSKNINIDELELRDKVILIRGFAFSRGKSLSLQEAMKMVKSMNDEFLFLGKRKKAAKGNDVKITDDVIYNHSAGKLTYNGFSIAVNDGRIKGPIYELSTALMRDYFRKNVTEQEVINRIINEYFGEISRIVRYSRNSDPINIIMNDNVNIKIEINKGAGNYSYLNERRTNKNEIVTIVKEMICYTSNETASVFIDNITKLGLSVYIGITTGYMFNERIYKFKKRKGRSQYSLMIGDIELSIKGKKLINKLYTITNVEGLSIGSNEQDAIDKIIFESIDNPIDYVKYKFLIDASYAEFIKKSQEFLDKKVDEVEGEYVNYYDTNRKKVLDGVKLTGSSTNSYVIAYDSKESFVFMNPTVREETEDKTTFEEGKYICMIDQSNIKTNIGYDTVISKMLSLKHDSMIASQIYNLEEELK